MGNNTFKEIKETGSNGLG